MTTFQQFGLADPLTRALAEENYVTPTPIQAEAIPPGLAGRDLIGIAQTGTGKTAAFTLPILHHLGQSAHKTEKRHCRALVLSPTRELSAQIHDSFRAYGRHLPFTSTLAIGGVPMGRQVRALMPGVDVLVATPGRLLDLVRSNALRLRQVEWFVLDEADRMLDMGFIHDVRKIVSLLPTARQTFLFSATMPPAIADLAGQMLREPVRVAVTPVASTAEKIDPQVIRVERQQKIGVLVDVLKRETVDRALIFTRTKHGADKLARNLERAGIRAGAIHGNKSQNNRERTLDEFRSGATPILVATDIAARGIDVEGVSHVFNFDLPEVPETYVHRIGRTARAGASGKAIALCDGEEVKLLRAIERLTGVAIPQVDMRGEAVATPAHVPGGPREGRPAGQREHPPHGRGRRGKGGHSGPRHGDQGPRNGDSSSRYGDQAPRRGEQSARHGEQGARRGDQTPRRGDGQRTEKGIKAVAFLNRTPAARSSKTARGPAHKES